MLHINEIKITEKTKLILFQLMERIITAKILKTVGLVAQERINVAKEHCVGLVAF